MTRKSGSSEPRVTRAAYRQREMIWLGGDCAFSARVHRGGRAAVASSRRCIRGVELLNHPQANPPKRVDINAPSFSPAPVSPGLPYFTERGSGPPLLLVHGVIITGE